jgi:hypothetical protein
MTAAVESVPTFFKRSSDGGNVRLDPTFTFLRTTMGRRTGFAWLGNTERDALGPIEVFYSGAGEVVRLQNGRITSAIGFPTEWRKVRWPELPAWAAIAQKSGEITFQRTRDVMPGYKTGTLDELTLRAIAPPKRSALRVLEPEKLTWFEERLRKPGDALPPAKYAVQIDGEKETVVYSEQCLATDFCFTWQRWSAALQAQEKAQR